MARARWGTRRVLLTRASLFAGDAVLLHHAVEVVARPRVMHNCFAKGAVSSLRNHVAHRSGMLVPFGVAEDAAAQRKHWDKTERCPLYPQ
jgi:hypothetical protein